MIDEFVVINSNHFKLKLLVNRVDMDYYTDITLKLYIGKKRIVLLEDNILFYKNMIYNYKDNIDVYSLDKRLDEKDLGLLLNEFYYCLYENITRNSIILDNQERWIGEKYCCFSNSDCATWIYKYNDNIVLKVTPMFRGFDKDNYFNQYLKFTKGYSDIFCTTITFNQLKDIYNIIIDLYHSMQNNNNPQV